MKPYSDTVTFNMDETPCYTHSMCTTHSMCIHIHSFDEAERTELVPTGIPDIFRQCVYYIKVVSPISTTCRYKRGNTVISSQPTIWVISGQEATCQSAADIGHGQFSCFQ